MKDEILSNLEQVQAVACQNPLDAEELNDPRVQDAISEVVSSVTANDYLKFRLGNGARVIWFLSTSKGPFEVHFWADPKFSDVYRIQARRGNVETEARIKADVKLLVVDSSGVVLITNRVPV